MSVARFAIVAGLLASSLHAQPVQKAIRDPLGGNSIGNPGKLVRILDDQAGMPHVYAGTDEGAYFGLGYVSARDRFMQMTLHRLLIYGRLSEFFGPDAKVAGDQGYVNYDIAMRLYGYERLAKSLYANMDAPGKALLEAYTAGVNRYVFPPNGSAPVLHPYFDPAIGLVVPLLPNDKVVFMREPWRPWDSIALWLRISRLYTNAEPVDLAKTLHVFEAWTNSGGTFVNGQPVGGDPVLFDQLFPPRVFAPGSAPVQENVDSETHRVDVDAAATWISSQDCVDSADAAKSFGSYYHGSFYLGQYVRGPFLGDALNEDPQALAMIATGTEQSAGFSNAWAVAGDTVARPAMLMGDPRIQVRIPNELYEASMSGATFHVRGTVVPGTPNFLVGSNGSVAWSVTALGMQQADLFRLRANTAQHPNEYRLDTGWVAMTTSPETIVVRHASPNPPTFVNMLHRESEFGPVITRFEADTLVVPDTKQDEEYALRWVPNEMLDAEPTSAFADLYRVGPGAPGGPTIGELFRRRLGKWTWPAVNCVYADVEGRVGYSVVGALPLRSCYSVLGGEIAQDGTTLKSLWRNIVPADYMPWVLMEPSATAFHHLHTGNQTPIDGTWYADVIPFVSRGGDTPRSRRLRELFDAMSARSPASIAAPHEDGAWVQGRDLLTLGLYLRNQQLWPFTSAAALSTLAAAGNWSLPAPGRDGQLTADDPATIANEAALSCVGRFVGLLPFRSTVQNGHFKPLVDTYGSGDYGLSSMLRVLIAKISATPPQNLTNLEAEYVEASLDHAWTKFLSIIPNFAASFTSSLTRAVPTWYPLEFKAAGWAPLAPSALTVGPVKVGYVHTLMDQFDQTYTQWLTLNSFGHVDALSRLAPGQCDNPNSSNYLNQAAEWASGPWQPQLLKPSPATWKEVHTPPSTIEATTNLYYKP
ncbi:MAG: penicillin acylase family protein [Planctomycetes bacterium]|nr:penicillin acylase family protein [Planctomycetota bacterium]